MNTTTSAGRRLPRPDEPIVDQGAAFDLATLASRRRVLAIIGASGAATLLAACSSDARPAAPTASSTTIAEIPDETAGPYPGDGSNGPDVLSRTGIVRRDIRSSIGGGATAEGVPLTVVLDVVDIAGDAPFSGAAVYLWQCDAAGGYSMYGEGIEDETYLRGVQVVDDAGTVTFSSIVPGCYAGRWPHIHFEVYPDRASITDHTAVVATSQLALPEDVCDTVYRRAGYAGSARNLARIDLASDMVFGDDGAAHQVATVTGNAVSGYRARLTVGVDTRTEPVAGPAPDGPRRAMRPSGPPPPRP